MSRRTCPPVHVEDAKITSAECLAESPIARQSGKLALLHSTAWTHNSLSLKTPRRASDEGMDRREAGKLRPLRRVARLLGYLLATRRTYSPNADNNYLACNAHFLVRGSRVRTCVCSCTRTPLSSTIQTPPYTKHTKNYTKIQDRSHTKASRGVVQTRSGPLPIRAGEGEPWEVLGHAARGGGHPESRQKGRIVRPEEKEGRDSVTLRRSGGRAGIVRRVRA